jgi:hypothetical protein
MSDPVRASGERRAGARPSSSTRGRRRLPTRVLLIAAAFAALQALVFFAVVPVTTALAAAAPPAYAVVAGIHSVLPFLVRLVTGVPGGATITAGITGLLTAALSPIGFLAAIPLLTAGAVFDAAMPWRAGGGPLPRWRVLTAALVAGLALFAVSLPVFSSEHLVPIVLAATLAGRLAGETLAALAAMGLALLLARAGLVRR